MAGVTKSTLFRYGVAVLAVAGAVVITQLLSGLGDSGISPQFFAAVLVSAWYGGRGPGLVATILSGLAAASMLITPESSASAIRDDIFRATVFTVVALITSSLHAATRRALASARSASEAKDHFLAMVSHELLTPLSPILMATEMMLDDPRLPPQMSNDLETIRRNLLLETRLVNDLLDLSRLSAGRLQVDIEPTDLHEVLQQTIALCEGEIEDRGQRLSVSFEAKQSIIDGDSLRLQQVFWNLLRNASKFTPHGGEISISTRDVPDGINITFTDTGMGFEPAATPTIFEPFEQGKNVDEFHHGLGLGLAIAKSLVLRHGGSISGESAGLGRGATFTIVLPLRDNRQSQERAALAATVQE